MRGALGAHLGPAPHQLLKRSLLLVAGLAAGVLLALGLYASFGALLDALSRFNWAWFPLALALTSLNYLIRFGRWEVYLRRLRIEVPTGRSFVIFLAGLTGTITPAKLGEVLKSGLLRRGYDVPVSRSAPIVLAERVTDAIGIALLTVVVGLGAAGSLPLAGAALALGCAVALLSRTKVLDRFARVATARAASAELLGLKLLVGMSLLAAVSWFFECLSAWVCVKGLGLDISLADTTVVFCIATLAGALSFVPGGLGVAEASMIGLFHRLGGVSKADAAAVTVLIRLATLWFAVAVGLVALGVEDRLDRRQAGGSPPARRSSIR